MKRLPFITAAILSSAIAFAETTNIAALARASIAKGAAWLEASQAEDGTWSNPSFPALTALPAWALSASGSSTGAIAKAVEFVRSCAQPDGGIYIQVPGRRGGALGTYNTAICMTALHFADNAGSIRVIQKAREYVASTQLVGDDGATGQNAGGFGYERNSPGGYADLNNSAWAIAAMRLTQDVEESRPAGEARADIDWEAARAYVEKMQVKHGEKGADPDDEGGFLYKRDGGGPGGPDGPRGGKGPPPWAKGGQEKGGPGGPGRPPLRSYGSITYSGLEAMIFAQVGRDDPRVVSAIDYARRHWTLDENPGMGQQGLYYYYTIMARALSLLDIDVLPPAEEGGEGVKWRDELIARVISLQREDGSWANSNNRYWENDPVLCTSYSLLTLEYALRLFR